MAETAVNARLVRLDRGYVEVSGPEAEDFLERMLSNEIASLDTGEARPALLLTPKGRIVAPLRVVRTAADSFVLVTDAAELAEVAAATLVASRFASKCAIEPRLWSGFAQLGSQPDPPAFRSGDYGADAWEGWRDEEIQDASDSSELEGLRIESVTPAWGKELDESILPAEAGLDETHISFTKGCFPGQEPLARLHYRGHTNRRLRRLEVVDAQPGAEIVWNEKVGGRVTSAVPGRALGYVRTEVPDGAVLLIDGAPARLH
jgi:folate-binding protein YgfZ